MDSIIRACIVRTMLKYGRPMKPRDIHTRVSNGGGRWTTADRWRILADMIRAGEIWNEGGALSLTDKINPKDFRLKRSKNELPLSRDLFPGSTTSNS